MSTKSGSRCQKLRITATWPAPMLAVALRLGGRGQHRRQGFTVQRPPLTQVGGLMNAPRRLGAADPQPVRQRRGQLATQLGRISLFGELVDQWVLDGGQHAAHLLTALQHGQPFGRGQHVERQVQGALVSGLERVEDLDDLLPTTRTHVRIITTVDPTSFAQRETQVTQVVWDASQRSSRISASSRGSLIIRSWQVSTGISVCTPPSAAMLRNCVRRKSA